MWRYSYCLVFQGATSTYYSQHSSLYLKDDGLKEAGFETGRSVTVKISQGCIVMMADCNEVQELREQLYQAKEGVGCAGLVG
ncbi:SymE family type I addiction module toxin [Phytobacter diazotrophicus]|uniref:SymE family type I addiction module toxin n=1 Tax=Phytobacter diazotrophicus TaxID=395631 RepID=UPI00232B3E8A|nr:SymE family type I addiction module toxin [Phytobacter diazotrophicus]MDC0727963.1 SymE family type I addiction module toxin [Phytobacter diazotrophicus]MDC0735237.1 SymE family type I addiction module toxin [Phytobacter diazotrophicus]